MREDTVDDIQRCLNCEYEVCSNCIDNGGYSPITKFNWIGYDRKKLSTSQLEFLDWYWLGYTDQEMADMLGKKKMTMTTRRCSLGLPFLPVYLDREQRKRMARKVFGGRKP